MSLPDIPNVERLSPYVTRILGNNPGPFTLQGTNTYLVGHPNTADRLLVDTGDGNEGYLVRLRSYLELSALRITHVVVTHSHYDHIRGVVGLRALAPEATFYHYKDAIHIEHDGVDPSIFEHWADGQQIEAANLHFIGFFTPGHCDDHLSIWLEEDNALFSGDNLLGHGSTVFNHYGNYLRSLQRMRDLPHLGVVYPGHGMVVANGVAAFNQYISHRMQRETDILQALANGNREMTTKEVVDCVYSDLDARPPRIRIAATRNTQQYLDKLVIEGKIAGENDSWRVSSMTSAKPPALLPVSTMRASCT